MAWDSHSRAAMTPTAPFRWLLTCLSTCLVAASPAVARAGDAAVPVDDAAALDGAAPEVGLSELAASDAAVGRAMFTDTAVTRRAGTWSASLAFPVVPLVSLADVRYGLTDRIELGIGGVTGLGTDLDDAQALPGLSAHVALQRGPRSATTLSVGGMARIGDGAGAVTGKLRHSACVDAACGTLATLSVGAVQLLNPEQAFDVYPEEGGMAALDATGATVTGSLLVGRRRVRMVVEYAALIGTPLAMNALYVGARVTTPRVALDLGLSGGATFAGEPFVLPMVAVAVAP